MKTATETTCLDSDFTDIYKVEIKRAKQAFLKLQRLKKTKCVLAQDT
jgi:hypothetical protein